MGWANGSALAQDLYDRIRGYIPESERVEIALEIYTLFTDYDADDWDGTSQLERDAHVNQEQE